MKTCSRGDDGEDPHPVDLERGHALSQQKRKRSLSKNDSQIQKAQGT
jgi:hypothetical protein